MKGRNSCMILTSEARSLELAKQLDETLGVRIDLHLPGRILDTSGWIYLWGRPVGGPDGVRIADLDFHEATASRLARPLSTA